MLRHLSLLHLIRTLATQESLRVQEEAVKGLTSCFVATGGLFRDAPRRFEQWSDDEEDTWAGASSPGFRTTPARGCSIHVRFSVRQVNKYVGSGFEPGGLRSRDLTTRPPLPYSCEE
ncbi:hypothetical protein AVEN_248382-1 [Araneus ventricosus]|uniref:Uncharacterized protein n=1 Tax=Araneus ventricosus TaxID=182803 RepID=A0A4Y2LPI3_ARAVE|nr:hypothetical protein AVEN_248382-1 [Araneus ventricosus]